MIRNFFVRGTDPANYEIGRALWALSVLSGIGYAGAHLYLNKVFDIVQFGLGMGSLMALGGGGIAAKDIANKKVEPS